VGFIPTVRSASDGGDEPRPTHCRRLRPDHPPRRPTDPDQELRRIGTDLCVTSFGHREGAAQNALPFRPGSLTRGWERRRTSPWQIDRCSQSVSTRRRGEERNDHSQSPRKRSMGLRKQPYVPKPSGRPRTRRKRHTRNPHKLIPGFLDLRSNLNKLLRRPAGGSGRVPFLE
jgi:hypothetical protein